MANNRMYLLNKTTNKIFMLAKHMAGGWCANIALDSLDNFFDEEANRRAFYKNDQCYTLIYEDDPSFGVDFVSREESLWSANDVAEHQTQFHRKEKIMEWKKLEEVELKAHTLYYVTHEKIGPGCFMAVYNDEAKEIVLYAPNSREALPLSITHLCELPGPIEQPATIAPVEAPKE